MAPDGKVNFGGATRDRVSALIETACALLREKVPPVDETQLHRLDKADTRRGLESLAAFSAMGVPYAMLLYERFLSRNIKRNSRSPARTPPEPGPFSSAGVDFPNLIL